MYSNFEKFQQVTLPSGDVSRDDKIVDQDQTALYKESDLGLHCLLRHSSQSILGNKADV